VAIVQKRPLAMLVVLQNGPAFAGAMVGMVFGPVLGVWLSMTATHHAELGVAATLMASSPLFMMPVSRLAYGARIGWLGFVGTVVAVGGAALLLLTR
jgi:drug/metabolite transporter (DMT)-like permease